MQADLSKSGRHSDCLDFHSEPERGATLLEVALSMTLFTSLILLANAIVSDELKRRSAIALGQDLRLMTQFTRQFVASEYDQIRSSFIQLGVGDAVREISMKEISDAGFLPPSMLASGNHRNAEDQKYGLMVRAVRRLDTHFPQTTLTIAEIDADSDGAVDLHWVDERVENDELDLEAVLVTFEGNEVPAQFGNLAVTASELAIAGYIQTADSAFGPYGNWSMNLIPFSALDIYPEAGRFASIVALSGFGILDFASNVPASETGNPFERCPGLSGAALAACAAANDIYTGIQFQSADINGDGRPDRFGEIRDVYSIQMGTPADSDGDGTADKLPDLTGLLRIACSDNANATISTGTLLLDCANIELSGDTKIAADLTVTGDSVVSGGATVRSGVNAERFLAGVIGNQDLTKGIYAASVISMIGNTEVVQPTCSDAGSDPQIFAVPVAYSSPDGSPVVGVNAFAEVVSGESKWKIRMRAALDRDNDNDGDADIVELSSMSDHVLALSKCD